MSSEPLREMWEQEKQITKELNDSIDLRTQKTNELAVAKAEVEKNQHRLALVKEQIMIEKKLISNFEGR